VIPTDDELAAARRWVRRRVLTGRIPGQALTKAQHDYLTEGRDRPLTGTDEIGAHPHPRPIVNEETNRP